MSTITYKILLADDNPINLDLTSRLLKKKGHEVTTAENGQEAVDLFLKDSFDVILMDLEMPIIERDRSRPTNKGQRESLSH